MTRAEKVVHILANEKWCSECEKWCPLDDFRIGVRFSSKGFTPYYGPICYRCREDLDRRFP